MNRLIILLLTTLVFSIQAFSQPEIKQPHIFTEAGIALFDKMEFRLSLPGYSNNYDPEVIKIDAVLTSPSGNTIVVPGFYFEDYVKERDFDCGLVVECEKLTKSKVQAFNWVIRFTPNEPGRWEYKIIATDKNGESTFPRNGIAEFNCKAANNKGFIYQMNERYLARDGKHLFLVGENIPWYKIKTLKKPRFHSVETGTNDYVRLIDSLAKYKANFARIWMNNISCISLLGKEWTTGKFHGFDNYNQKDAWQLDRIMEYANEKGIDVNLCLLAISSFSDASYAHWKNANPFNRNNKKFKGNGDGVNTPFEVFYDKPAIKQMKNLFRYIIARWGHSTNLIAWELWNEENLLIQAYGEENLPISTGEYYEHVVSWHNSMADYIRETDPYNHLITTSSPDEYCCSEKEYPDVWFNLDMVISHDYKAVDNLTFPFALNKHFLRQANEVFDNPDLDNKPYMSQEWGVSPLEDSYKFDPQGYILHNILWSSSMSGAMGAAAFWSWDRYIHRQDLYKRFEAVSVFMNSIVPSLDGTNRGSWFQSNGLGVFYMNDKQANMVVGWCQDVNYSFSSVKNTPYIKDLKTNKPEVSYHNNKISIRVRKSKIVYSVKWYSSETAGLVWEGKVSSKRRRVTFAMPVSLRNSTFGDGVFLITKD